MGYLEGFGITIRKWLGPGTDTGRRVTLQYPEQTRPKPERFHGRHVLNRYEDGMEKCIGCELCAGVCPAKCIYVRGADNDPDDPTSPGERFGFIYEINYLRCIHCDLCVEACPTEAITETKLFEFAFTNRSDAIYTKSELVVGDDGRPQQLPWENWDGGFDPAQDASGWMRATAPSGHAEFNGIVAWAGELGFGVRAPEGGGRVQPDVVDVPDSPAPLAADHDSSDDHAGDVPTDSEAEGPFAAPELASEEQPLPPLSETEDLDLQEPSPLLVDADDADDAAASYETDTLPALGDEPEPEVGTSSEAESQRQTAGFFDAPGSSDAVQERSAPLPPLDEAARDADDARVAKAVEEAFADTSVEPVDVDVDEDADTDADPDDGATSPDAITPEGDDVADGDDAPAPAPPSGPGFFDLPDAPASESDPKRRRRGWGRR